MIKQAWLANQLGVNRATVSRWVSGERNCNMEVYELIGDILGSTVLVKWMHSDIEGAETE
jgi:plasmid maintenance system antidote protein VapI